MDAGQSVPRRVGTHRYRCLPGVPASDPRDRLQLRRIDQLKPPEVDMTVYLKPFGFLDCWYWTECLNAGENAGVSPDRGVRLCSRHRRGTSTALQTPVDARIAVIHSLCVATICVWCCKIARTNSRMHGARHASRKQLRHGQHVQVRAGPPDYRSECICALAPSLKYLLDTMPQHREC